MDFLVINGRNYHPAKPVLDLVAGLRARSYPHMCRMDHQEIGHRDSESEDCPLCRVRNLLMTGMDIAAEAAGEQQSYDFKPRAALFAANALKELRRKG